MPLRLILQFRKESNRFSTLTQQGPNPTLQSIRLYYKPFHRINNHNDCTSNVIFIFAQASFTSAFQV
uniref:Uncharacterized protein n=1 Tax=Lepeophtheirus salmonis TaxID=72036 RepID=A0A0K2T6P0_LEPSM